VAQRAESEFTLDTASELAAAERGSEIRGLDRAAAEPGVLVFHAGTAARGEKIVTSGGRVLNVTALGDDLADARTRAYAAADLIHFDGMQRRNDIAGAAAVAQV